MAGWLPQFGCVEEYFSATRGTDVLLARYDELLKAVDSGDPADADNWLRWARKIGVSEPDLAHFFEDWLSLDGDNPEATGLGFVSAFLDATRDGRLHGLPLAIVLVGNDSGTLVRVNHVVTGPAIVIVVSVPRVIVQAKRG